MSARSPFMARMKVIALALLGYAFVLSWVVVALALAGGAIALLVAMPRFSTVKIALFLGLGALGSLLMVWRAMSVPPGEPPRGKAITRPQAPELFRILDRLLNELRVGPLEQVLLIDGMNAAMVQVPRRGLFGNRRYLLLGLPLLYALSPEQATSVIAHELGHASANHGRTAGWIYALRLRWVKLMETLDQEASLSAVITRAFFRWYAPTFMKASFALAREREYEADAIAAGLVGASVAGQALCRTEIAAEWLEVDYLPSLRSRVTSEPAPPRLFLELAERLSKLPEDHAERLSRALVRARDPHDTHPSLRERLIALGVQPAINADSEFEGSAASAWLGTSLASIADEWSARWQLEVGEDWRTDHFVHRQATRALARLESRVLETDEERLEIAVLREQVGRREDAIAAYTAFLERSPDHASALFGRGRARLAIDDGAGLDDLKRAHALNAELVIEVARILIPWLGINGRHAEAEGWLARAEVHREKQERARDERDHVRTGDRFKPANAPEVRARLAAWHRAHPQHGAVYLVEKVLQYRGSPLFIVAVDAAAGVTGNELMEIGLGEILDAIPGAWLVPLKSNPALRIAITKVPGARIG